MRLWIGIQPLRTNHIYSVLGGKLEIKDTIEDAIVDAVKEGELLIVSYFTRFIQYRSEQGTKMHAQLSDVTAKE